MASGITPYSLDGKLDHVIVEHILRHFVNVGTADNWTLLVAWLIAALRPSGPYPVLVVNGVQGSAKSTTCRVLRRLVDPNKAALRSEPRAERDLVIAASNGWVIGLDNLSCVKTWLSDALCRIATGGGFATRELFSDGDEVIFAAQRPIVLNGITELATRSDLLDRAIQLTLPTIPEHKRRTETDFWADFNVVRPAILGTLLDAVSMALARIDSVELDRLPRMADFVVWIVAAEPVLSWEPGAFLPAYDGNRAQAHELAIESSHVATVVLAMIEGRGEWTGTAADLLAELELDQCSDERMRWRNDWLKTPRKLIGNLRHVAPNLRALGVNITFDRRVGYAAECDGRRARAPTANGNRNRGRLR